MVNIMIVDDETPSRRQVLSELTKEKHLRGAKQRGGAEAYAEFQARHFNQRHKYAQNARHRPCTEGFGDLSEM